MKFTNRRTGYMMLLGLLVAGAATVAAAEPVLVDLRPKLEQWGLGTRRQGGRGTCSVFAVTGALEFALARKEGRGTRLSPEFLNWASNRKCGNRQDGGFFSDLWKGFEACGICTEGELPYAKDFNPDLSPDAGLLARASKRREQGLAIHWIKKWDVKTGLDDNHLVSIKSTLSSGWPVCGGFRWPKREQWKDGVLRMCPPEDVVDGHSVLLLGYREDPAQPGGGLFIFRNSGGDGSDGSMPYAYVRLFMNDAMWVGCQLEK